MGNQYGKCSLNEFFNWHFQPKPNLPPKGKLGERPKPDSPVDLDKADYLGIRDWNLELKKNGELHHTKDYYHMRRSSEVLTSSGKTEPPKDTLVIRRGQPFYLTLNTNIPYDKEKHKISLMFFVTDVATNFGNKTQVGVKIDAEDGFDGWCGQIHNNSDTTITLEVRTSPNAITGEWRMEVDVNSEGEVHCFECPYQFFLLFNPWCKDDPVFLDVDDERHEYVLLDSGLIWRGTHSRLRPCPWQFGQYEKDVLECILYVLSKVCKVIPAHRADPIKVVRAISAGVNSPDDSGILVGNWSCKYEEGTPPTQWRGSTDIIQQYYGKKKPIKYGQCWVFSGVVTTACRAIGIPCRPVTNFASAHDTHSSLTLDYFFGEEGEALKDMNIDSVWNFHVWNEVWMARPDIGPDYGGWQVIDATPQEESDGQYRCGPSSLKAIMRGEILCPYDSPFVYAEVNADTLYWKYQGQRQPVKLLGRKTGGVGLNISTKAIGKMKREDITHLYKEKEDSAAERNVMQEALRRCDNAFARYYLNEQFEDISFELKLKDDIIIGQPFSVETTVKNKSINDYEISLVLRADTMLYTGVIKNHVKKHESSIILKAQSTKEVKMDITFDDYYNKLVDQCAFNISCLGKVKDSNFEYFAQDDFRVRKPDIDIKLKEENTGMFVGRTCTWTASFTNPLPIALTKCKFIILPNNIGSFSKTLKKKFGPNEEASVDFELTPKRDGEMTVSVVFTSKELEDVDGVITYEVLEKEEVLHNKEEENGDEKEKEKDQKEKDSEEKEESRKEEE